MSAERLWLAVELDHRAKVAAASDAYARHRPRDELAKVLVLQRFWVSGREVQPDEIVEIPGWLLSDLVIRGHVEKV